MTLLDHVTVLHPTLASCPLKVAHTLAETLQERAKCSVLCFNLCDEDKRYDSTSPFMVNARWRGAVPGSPMPTLEHLLRILYAMRTWLRMSNSNRALVVCESGSSPRSALVIAAFLKYTRKVPTCTAGFILFHRSRRPSVELSNADIQTKPLLQAFLNNVDTVLDSGRYPNPVPFTLAAIVVEGLLVADLPEVEVWNDSQCVFRSAQSLECDTDWDYDSATAVYRTNCAISGDVAVLVRLGVAAEDEHISDKAGCADGDDFTILRYVSSTGFMCIGSHDVGDGKVSVVNVEDTTELFDDGLFQLSLILERCPNDVPMLADVEPNAHETALRGIADIIEWHSQSFDKTLHQKMAFTFQGMHTRGLALALLLASNDYNKAVKFVHEFRLCDLLQAKLQAAIFPSASISGARPLITPSKLRRSHSFSGGDRFDTIGNGGGVSIPSGDSQQDNLSAVLPSQGAARKQVGEAKHFSETLPREHLKENQSSGIHVSRSVQTRSAGGGVTGCLVERKGGSAAGHNNRLLDELDGDISLDNYSGNVSSDDCRGEVATEFNAQRPRSAGRLLGTTRADQTNERGCSGNGGSSLDPSYSGSTLSLGSVEVEGCNSLAQSGIESGKVFSENLTTGFSMRPQTVEMPFSQADGSSTAEVTGSNGGGARRFSKNGSQAVRFIGSNLDVDVESTQAHKSGSAQSKEDCVTSERCEIDGTSTCRGQGGYDVSRSERAPILTSTHGADGNSEEANVPSNSNIKNGTPLVRSKKKLPRSQGDFVLVRSKASEESGSYLLTGNGARIPNFGAFAAGDDKPDSINCDQLPISDRSSGQLESSLRSKQGESSAAAGSNNSTSEKMKDHTAQKSITQNYRNLSDGHADSYGDGSETNRLESQSASVAGICGNDHGGFHSREKGESGDFDKTVENRRKSMTTKEASNIDRGRQDHSCVDVQNCDGERKKLEGSTPTEEDAPRESQSQKTNAEIGKEVTCPVEVASKTIEATQKDVQEESPPQKTNDVTKTEDTSPSDPKTVPVEVAKGVADEQTEAAQKPEAQPTITTAPGTAIKDDPRFAKYLTMLRMHVPKQAVANKMTQEGLDSAILDMDPNEPVPQQHEEHGEEEDVPIVAIKDDPRFTKYLTMLRMHVPKQAVANKMIQEGLDPTVLDMDPNDPVPGQHSAERDDDEPRIAIKDDERFIKYLTMLRMHVPKQAVANKMIQEGLDPTVLDMDPNEPVPSPSSKASSAPVPPEKLYRRKRLHWNSIDPSRLQRGNCIWSSLNEEGGENVIIDDTEFDLLFVDKNEEGKTTKANVDSDKEKKLDKSKLSVIDGKRSMNCCIALARIKVPYANIAISLQHFEGGKFTADQLVSLTEFLPTDEEVQKLKQFLSTSKSDTSRLGEAEKFMLHMMDVPRCEERFNCLVLQKSYESAEKNIRDQVAILERACDDAKRSTRLKKILSVVLKLGNKLNAGSSKVAAFTLDSLVKLKDSKAFDKKTTVMQFLARLLERHDPDTLSFRKDLSNIPDASAVSLSSILTEIDTLEAQLEDARGVLGCEALEAKSEGYLGPGLDLSAMPYSSFLQAAGCRLLALRQESALVDRKYCDVLLYFGEDPELSSTEFFRTLNQFVASFDQSALEVKEMLRHEAMVARRKKEADDKLRTESTKIAMPEELPQQDASSLMLERARAIRNKTYQDSSSESEDGFDEPTTAESNA